jgi:hypothetical protein
MIGERVGEFLASRRTEAAIGDAVRDHDDEDQRLGEELEILRAGIDVEVSLAHALQRVLRDAPGDEPHRPADLAGALGPRLVEPGALDAHQGLPI